jgi:coproporphyrinogen III oxidase-like Fe-S oxidoreductase
MADTRATSLAEPEVGSYFVANYPPFSVWTTEAVVRAAVPALASPPGRDVPLGLYLHIPFCRKRCHFCYFRVYTNKNAQQVEQYLDWLVQEWALVRAQTGLANRPLDFVYFGGGTPSFLSTRQLDSLVSRLGAIAPWSSAGEITFECEPGTLNDANKLETIRDAGVTRLSLGVENFKPEILQFNGRAHLEDEIYRAYEWARELGFDQINIDLIAGMVGEDWDNWKDCVRKTIAMAPESVTVYQMELPYNTTFSKELKVIGQDEPALEIADWPTKRAWVRYAFDELAAAGYEQSSAYTMVRKRPGHSTEFVYRDSLWHGADMFGTGVASFGEVHGVHMQNEDRWEDYVGTLLEKGELPLHRALPVTDHQRMIREMILQLKTGRIQAAYFRAKFEKDILAEFGDQFRELEERDILAVTDSGVTVFPDGLLQIDRYLPTFFEPEHRGTRYT